jgi:carotenoid cleavage dioxygenase-like enzyme
MQTQQRDVRRDRFAEGKPLWARAIATPATEFGSVALNLISGAIPTDLRGTLYRNGPGRLTRQGQSVNHWFDGDGGILAVRFHDAGTTASYRYVQTPQLQAEAARDQFLYSGYGQLAPGPLWRRWGVPAKNVANTSVLALPDQLLALWEGGNPYALDPTTLTTIGVDLLSGLTPKLTYSAHPKRDPHTGKIYNFGVIFGLKAHLQLYCSHPSGEIYRQATIPLPRLSLVHDFALAGRYLVFVVPPLSLQMLPVLVGLQSLSDALQWQPQQGTQIIIVDRDTFQEVTRLETEPWFQWHFGNGYETPAGEIVLDYIRYPNFQTNQWLKEVVSGCPQTPASGRLWQLRIHPQTGKILENEQRFHLGCEFPVVSPLETGQNAQGLYLNHQASADAPTAEMFNSIARIDGQTHAIASLTFPQGCYPMEPIYAPHPHQKGQGWILTVVFDGNQDQSTVQIFSAEQLDAGSIAVLELPEVIPFGFHGTWQSALMLS